MKQETQKTKDLWFAAFLVTLGYEVTKVTLNPNKRSEKILHFEFPEGAVDLAELRDGFYRNEILVGAADLRNNVRSLKSLLQHY